MSPGHTSFVSDEEQSTLIAVVAEKEGDLATLRERHRALEKELWAARKLLRQRRRVDSIRMAGFGALAGNVVGAAGWAITDNAWALLAASLVGTLFGFVLGHVWDPLDDGVPEANVSNISN